MRGDVGRLLVLVSVLVGWCPSSGFAQPFSCGNYSKGNDSRQFADFRAVEVKVWTKRDLVSCPIITRAEGWVGGTGGAGNAEGAFYAETAMVVPVRSYKRYTVYGKHWLIIAGIWNYLGTSLAYVTLVPPDPPKPPSQECEDNGGFWNEETRYCNDGSPILIDVDGDGYHLTSVDDGVFFDVNADGQAEQTAWTRVGDDGSVDAWLAFDKNGNGRIDHGGELFGNNTAMFAFEGQEVKAANGFEALKGSESPDSFVGAGVPDRRIDPRDGIWARLLLWRDANHNGISEPHELQPLSSSGIVSISTDYEVKRRRDRHGNAFRLKSHATIETAGGGTRRLPIFDVWLQSR